MEWTPEVTKSRRIAKGLTQTQLAKAAGVSRSIVSKWETGERDPSGRNIRALDKILGTVGSRDVSIGEATKLELLNELINRELADLREHADGDPQPSPSLPSEDLDWDDKGLRSIDHSDGRMIE